MSDAAGQNPFEEDNFAQQPASAEPAPYPQAPRQPDAKPQFFGAYMQPEPVPTARIPHVGHLLLLAILAFFGLFVASMLTRSALYFHLFGVSTVKQALGDIRYTLGGQAFSYVFALGACLIFFPLVWQKGFFEGLQWRGTTALRLRGSLFGAAFACFVLAIVNGLLLPGPNDTPIDKIFRTPGAAWLLFVFGVTFAPFFEEIAFRGFLLPALATAFDWGVEQYTHQPARPLDYNGHPQWSFAAMATGSVITSIPFALMHADQTGHAIGPFLLLVAVSLVLCWARLATRSLAASVMVHSCYNLLLFSVMLLSTGGFRHMDKM